MKERAKRKYSKRKKTIYSILKDGLSLRHFKKPRKCLRCGKKFVSTWCGDRICKKCELAEYNATYYATNTNGTQ